MLQEVYDWAGANESFPPYFTLHRGSVLVSHEETVQNDETLQMHIWKDHIFELRRKI